MNRQKIYQSIDTEREYQIERGSDLAHDQEHSAADFALFIERHLQELKNRLYDFGADQAAHQFRKIAALCVAYGEAHGLPPRRK